MTIEYANVDMEPISLEQLELVTEYFKLYKVDGLLKKIESYDNNQLEDIEYYISENESIDDVFMEAGTNSLEIVTNLAYNQYTIKTITYYNNGAVVATDKELLYKGMILCFSELNAIGEANLLFSRKYFYDENGEEQFNFSYNEDGSLRSFYGFSYPFSEFNQSLPATDISTYFPNFLLDNPYYLNFDFLPE